MSYLIIKKRLGTQFTAKILGWIGGRATNGSGHIGHVYNDGFDAIALALYLGLNAWHFIAIEYIGDIAIYINRTHVEKL